MIYAAIGVALGTFTGTALAVASLQPGGISASNHFAFARSIATGPRIHSISNAGPAQVTHVSLADQVVIAQPPASLRFASAAPVPIGTPSAPAPIVKSAIVSERIAAAPTVKAEIALAPIARTPAVQTTIRQSQIATASIAAAPVVKASTATLGIAKAPIVHTQIANSPSSVEKQTATAAPALSTNATRPPPANALALASKPVQADMPAPAATSAAVAPVSLDGGFKPLLFYSEGDATVADYSAAGGGTIVTDDGRTFLIGAAVTASNAAPWEQYRANVHYRCDQNGNCMLVRTGAVALNAKLM
ncbi:MAG: hypothetical protein WBE72_13860 [Terracidiphilus sp.]